jgi:hypothetical protein
MDAVRGCPLCARDSEARYPTLCTIRGAIPQLDEQLDRIHRGGNDGLLALPSGIFGRRGGFHWDWNRIFNGEVQYTAGSRFQGMPVELHRKDNGALQELSSPAFWGPHFWDQVMKRAFNSDGVKQAMWAPGLRTPGAIQSAVVRAKAPGSSC